MPSDESDPALTLAYHARLGGQRLEGIALRRTEEALLDGLGAQRIPDPTPSGEFTRRFDHRPPNAAGRAAWGRCAKR